MGRRLLLSVLVVLGFAFEISSKASADQYLNQTKEERPRKKKKVKGFDYENSRYISKAMDRGSKYVYDENGRPVLAESELKKGKAGKKKAEDGDSESAS